VIVITLHHIGSGNYLYSFVYPSQLRGLRRLNSHYAVICRPSMSVGTSKFASEQSVQDAANLARRRFRRAKAADFQ
jgi:hypothetical protein